MLISFRKSDLCMAKCRCMPRPRCRTSRADLGVVISYLLGLTREAATALMTNCHVVVTIIVRAGSV